MPNSHQEIRESLMASDAEFRRLAEEHTQYESQLDQIEKSPYRSSEDLMRQATLKKLKLRVKDRMEELVARHRQKSS